jgi:hypothetical protein
VWAAGRIFRVGILMQGKGAKLGEMMRWVFSTDRFAWHKY